MNICRPLRIFFCLAFLAASSGSAFAELVQIGPNTFVAGVTSSQFEFFAAPFHAGRQRQANWCWAASIQMLLNFHGLRVTQEEIVRQVFGALVDQGAQPHEILAALNGWKPNAGGAFSPVQALPYPFDPRRIIKDLAYRWPLIVGLRNEDGSGHAVVLTAISYHLDSLGNPVFERVIIRDPWPGNPSRQDIPWPEFQRRLQFMAHVRVFRDGLTTWEP